MLDVDGPALDAQAAELARTMRVQGYQCDVADQASAASTIASIGTDLGGIDLLFCNAGISHRSAAARTDPGVFEKVMAVNYFGSVYPTLAALPQLLTRRGHIVVTSSIAGFAPVLGRAAYCASKHALHGFFETLGAEVRGQLAVQLVCPGFTQTDIALRALDNRGAMVDLPRVEIGSAADPADVARKIVASLSSRRRVVVLSRLGRASRWLHHRAPRLYERAMRRRLHSEMR
jgi:NAD(P)-dependent dehydrogenase (short-subunit alcohol dehydrogenase family)